ncbi:MAG: rod shape-determining protein MreC [Calditrichota bacterium]
MNPQAIVAYLKKPIFLLLAYILLSFFLMSVSETNPERFPRSLLLSVVETTDNMREEFSYRTNLFEENETLRNKNFKLETEIQNLREILAENARLRKMLELKEEKKATYIAGRIVGESVERRIRSLIIDVGREDGIKRNMAVVNPDGLIGKVLATSDGQAIIQQLVDHNALVSVTLQNSREKGVVSWSGNSWLELLYIPKNIPVSRGETVVTSGISQIYPPGIKVGVVTSVEEDEFNLFKSIRIKPAVNFNALEEVFLIVPDSSLADSSGVIANE